MSDQSNTHQSNNSLEEILKELEERFGVNADDEKKPDFKKSKGINFRRFGQNQIIGGLTLVLLVVGAAVGVYLGQTNQENRQQASVAYPVCGAGSSPDCLGTDPNAHEACITSSGAQGSCQPNTETNPACACIANGACVSSGAICDVNSPSCCNSLERCLDGICQVPASQCDSCVHGTSTCPAGQTESGTCSIGSLRGVCCIGAAATNTPIPNTNTPIPPATNTPIPPATNTPVPSPTNTPVPPTNPPPTNTPTRTPTLTPTRTPTRTPTSSFTPSPTVTPPAPTCNSITIDYGGSDPNRPVKLGDNIQLTCGIAANATPTTRYEFRLYLNNVFLTGINPLTANSNISQPYTIAQPGLYSAQCRVCADSTAASCQAWETP